MYVTCKISHDLRKCRVSLVPKCIYMKDEIFINVKKCTRHMTFLKIL